MSSSESALDHLSDAWQSFNTPLRLIDRWQGKRILVVGDPGYDVYHWGHVDRISPEAPVPVFVEDRIEDRPGMAYNVCQNLAALGCVPVQCFPPQPWLVKRRYMAGNHQLLRVDQGRDHPASYRQSPRPRSEERRVGKEC